MLKRGDTVQVTCQGNRIKATVELAGESQLSAVISYDGILGGFVCGMPLARETIEQPWRSLFGGVVVTIEEPDRHVN